MTTATEDVPRLCGECQRPLPASSGKWCPDCWAKAKAMILKDLGFDSEDEIPDWGFDPDDELPEW